MDVTMKWLIISAPRVSNLSQQTCSIEWQPCKAIQGSSLEYVLQLQGEQEYQKVRETKMSLFILTQPLDVQLFVWLLYVFLYGLKRIILWSIVSVSSIKIFIPMKIHWSWVKNVSNFVVDNHERFYFILHPTDIQRRRHMFPGGKLVS